MGVDLDFEPSGKEVMSALGAVFICLSETLPPKQANRIAKNLRGVAQRISAAGEPNVAKICIKFSQSFEMPHEASK